MHTNQREYSTEPSSKMENQKESAPKAEVASINDLPDEMLCEIFSHLCDIKDVLNTRRVCFRWYDVQRWFMKLNKLTLTESPIEQMKLMKKIETIEDCPKKINNFFLNGSDWQMFAEKQVELVNNLKFIRIRLGRREYDYLKFDLPNLEILVCDWWNCEKDIEINCPKLRELVYHERYTKLSGLRVTYPLSVKKLDTDLRGASVRRFENLEDLTTNEFRTLKQVDRLPKLKRVRFTGNFYSFSWKTEEILEKTKQDIRKIMDKLKSIDNPEIKFIYSGFEMNLNDRYLETMRLSEVHWDIQREGSIHQMNVSKLVSEVGRKRIWRYSPFDSVRMAKKLPEVYGLEVGMDKYKNKKVLKFIRNLKNLKQLDIRSWKGETKFYNQLPKVAPKLRKIVLSKRPFGERWIVRLDFLNEFPDLVVTRIFAEITREAAETGFLWLSRGSWRIFAFGTLEVDTTIERRNERFSLRIKEDEWFVKDLSGMIDLLYPEEDIVFERGRVEDRKSGSSAISNPSQVSGFQAVEM